MGKDPKPFLQRKDYQHISDFGQAGTPQVIVQARKPDFFNHNMSLYEVVTDDGLMRPVMKARKGALFCGGSARMVEAALGIEGDDILYVGDHIYTDAALAKINFRWRTALIVSTLCMGTATAQSVQCAPGQHC